MQQANQSIFKTIAGAFIGTMAGVGLWAFLLLIFFPQQVIPSPAGKDAFDILVNVLTITLAILALVATLAGVATWKILHQEMVARVEAAISSWDREIKTNQMYSSAINLLQDSMLNYQEYEFKWLRELESGASAQPIIGEEAGFYLARSLELAELAEEAANQLESEAYMSLLLACKNSLAYHLATNYLLNGGSQGNAKRAIDLAKWVLSNAHSDSDYEHRHRETVGWVMMSCGSRMRREADPQAEQLYANGKTIVIDALRLPKATLELGWREAICRKYKIVFRETFT